jgi:hypothetical protein
MFPEEWRLIDSGDADPTTGRPYAKVARYQADKWLTVWKLLKWDDWRIASVYTSDNNNRTFSGKGTRLSVSKLDTALRDMAERHELPEAY